MARRTRRQALGQHFLVDDSVAEHIIEAAGVGEGDRVLEVGPGHGVLTQRLLEGPAELVTVIERDAVLAATLRARWGRTPGFMLIEDDARRVEWPPFDIFVSNLPYSVATPLLLRLLEGPRGWRRAVVMVQAEVARRLVAIGGAGGKSGGSGGGGGTGKGGSGGAGAAAAKAGDYGRLSVAVAYRAQARKIFNVGRAAFSPQPRVHSAVVVLEPLAEPPFEVADEGFYFEFVARAFGHRRKTLRNCLKLAWPDLNVAGFEGLGRRAEELTPAELAVLADAVYDKINAKKLDADFAD